MPRPKLDDAEKLASLSVRTTQRQLARLQRVSNTDGLPTQDHVRRALDEYLDRFEAKFSLPMLPIGAVPNTPAVAAPVTSEGVLTALQAQPVATPREVAPLVPAPTAPVAPATPIPTAPVAPATPIPTAPVPLAMDLPEIEE